MNSDRKDLDFTKGNRKSRPEDVLHLAEQRAGMTATEALQAVRPVEPLNFTQIFTEAGCADTIERCRRQLIALPDQQLLIDMAAAATKGLAIISPTVAAREVATLVAAFPNASPASPEIFMSTLIYDLLDLRIPDAALVEACRRLRRTSKFLPSISQVVQTAESLREDWQMVEALPTIASQARAQLEENLRVAAARLHHIQQRAEAEAEKVELPKQPEPPSVLHNFPKLVTAFRDDPVLYPLLKTLSREDCCTVSGTLVLLGKGCAEAVLRAAPGERQAEYARLRDASNLPALRRGAGGQSAA